MWWHVGTAELPVTAMTVSLSAVAGSRKGALGNLAEPLTAAEMTAAEGQSGLGVRCRKIEILLCFQRPLVNKQTIAVDASFNGFPTTRHPTTPQFEESVSVGNEGGTEVGSV